MHIEPRYTMPAKVMIANAVMIWGAKEHIRNLAREPWAPLKVLAASMVFSLVMQSLHMPAERSALHFVGAMASYTLLGFALGLLLQDRLFEPANLYQHAVRRRLFAVRQPTLAS